MIIIDYKDRRPIYEQIVERFQELILKGILGSDTQLPSVRNLAMELSINPNTIQKAYTELERQGYTYSVKGRGSFIAETDKLVKMKRDEILEAATLLVKVAKEYGVAKDEFINAIASGFKED